MGMAVGPNIPGEEMVVGGKYELSFNNGTVIQGALDRILFNDTYIFENIKGGEVLVDLTDSDQLKANEFPFPAGLFYTTKFKVVI